MSHYDEQRENDSEILNNICRNCRTFSDDLHDRTCNNCLQPSEQELIDRIVNSMVAFTE